MKTIGALIEEATVCLKTAGVESARWDAERLLAHQLEESRLALYAYPERRINSETEAVFARTVRRRSAREPLQYLVGYQEFWGILFKVGRDVLIPRPESELLVEAVLELKKDGRLPEKLNIVDIGTGSGCLAVSLAKEFPKSRVYATDLSEKALLAAKENADKNGVGDRIRFLPGDLFAPLRLHGLAGRFDLIVSNPPYIPKVAMANLQPEVRDYEPPLALDGGPDGLRFHDLLLSSGTFEI